MRVIFWQNIVSPHQVGYMRALAEIGNEVTVVAAERMSAARERLGWQPPDLGQVSLVVSPATSDVRRLVRDSAPDAIHCIAGARVVRLGSLVAKECQAARRRMGIISEAADPRGFGGLLRWAKYSTERHLIGRSFDFVLAMGELGVRWFRACGYPEARVFPFCYVTQEGDAVLRDDSCPTPRFLFVGQLIDRKGLDLLLTAIAGVSHVELDVIGDGPQRDTLQSQARALGIASRVRWLGKLGQQEVPGMLASGLAVVLPSRHDGWGAVINEALMAGTPVICSSASGASDLVRHDWLGSVVPTGDVSALRSALAEWAKHGRTADDRHRIRTWARCITGKRVAGYLEAVLRHVYEAGDRPLAPWRTQE